MIEYAPTKAQKVAKERFWHVVGNNPLIDPPSLPVAQIARLARNSTVVNWMEVPGFAEWFFDKQDIKVKIALGAAEAIDRLVQIVNESIVGPKEAVSAATQVAAAKILMEYAGLQPADKKEVTVKADELPSDEAELRKYIDDKMRKLGMETSN